MYATVTYMHHAFDPQNFEVNVAGNGRVHLHEKHNGAAGAPVIYMSWDSVDEAYEFCQKILYGLTRERRDDEC